jgi:hypothetical protein
VEEQTLYAGLVNHAKSAASHLVLKYLARASVAIPFIVALGFVLAAIAAMLVGRFGHVTAYWIMAAGLATIPVIAAIAVSVKEHEEDAAAQKVEQTDTQEVVSEAAAQAMIEAPLALLGSLFTAPEGATSALKLARILARNLPLVLLLVMIGALFWPTSESDTVAVDEPGRRPNGLSPADTYH